MKNLRRNALVLLLITIIILYFVVKDDFTTIVSTLTTINLLWFLVAILFYFLYVFIKAYVLYLTAKTEKDNFSYPQALKFTWITQFFNGITPFSTGGQPMEIYLLKKDGIKAAKGTSIIIQTFVFYQIALVLLGLLAVGANYFFGFFHELPLLRKLILIGFCCNTAVAIVLLLISFSNKVNHFVANKVIAFLSKLKLIRKKEQMIENWNQRLDDFHDNAVKLRKNKALFVKGVFLNLCSLTIYYALPLFILYSMHDYTSLNLLKTITSSAYVLIIGSFVPIPGASGGIEFGFMTFFGTFLTGAKLSVLLLIWRFLTYYLGMLIGAILFNVYIKEVKE